jgi:transposase-like protein
MDSALNLSQLAKYFSDEDAARELLEEMRWGKNGAVCPHCGGADPYKLVAKATSKKPGRKGLYKCKACRKQFTVTVKTVFEDSRIPISKWLLALHLLASSKKGVSAHQLHRNLGISYKAAWFMAHRLRYAMSDGNPLEQMVGTIEADETYVGGRRKRMRGETKQEAQKAKFDNKVPVVALVNRDTGKVRATVMPRVTRENLHEYIGKNVEMKHSRLYTDEAPVYEHIGRRFFSHEQVNHTKGEYARGTVNTNSAEGFFGILKRGITGVYHHVGKGHLSKYVDEFSFRYNSRTVSDGKRAEMLVQGAAGKRLTYKQPA